MFSGVFSTTTPNKSYTLSEVGSGLMNTNILKGTQSTLVLTNLKGFNRRGDTVMFTADAVYNTTNNLGPIGFTLNLKTKHIYSESPGLLQGRIFTSNELFKGGARRTRNRRANKRKSRRHNQK